MLAVQDRIYVLLEPTSHTLQVYDRQGNYCHTYFFYDGFRNGRLMLAAKGDCVYLADERFNIYLFRQGCFEEYLTGEAAIGVRDEVSFQPQCNTEGFWIQGNGVWSDVAGEANCIISGSGVPLARMLYLPVGILGILLAWMLRKKNP